MSNIFLHEYASSLFISKGYEVWVHNMTETTFYTHGDANIARTFTFGVKRFKHPLTQKDPDDWLAITVDRAECLDEEKACFLLTSYNERFDCVDKTVVLLDKAVDEMLLDIHKQFYILQQDYDKRRNLARRLLGK